MFEVREPPKHMSLAYMAVRTLKSACSSRGSYPLLNNLDTKAPPTFLANEPE